jgi:hypothetical protein
LIDFNSKVTLSGYPDFIQGVVVAINEHYGFARVYWNTGNTTSHTISDLREVKVD